MSPLIMLFCIFLATFLAILGVGLLVTRRTGAERLAELGSNRQEAAVAAAPAPGMENSLLEPLLRENGFMERLQEELARAGMNLRPTDLLALVVIGGMVVGVVGYVLTHQIALALAGEVVGALVPLAAVKVAQSQRRAKFEAQLPDMLSLISSSVRSGYSFLQALTMVSQEMQRPVSEEADRVLEEVKVGLSVDEALERMVGRVRSYDMDMIATAISIQMQLGGNLAELLDTVGETIRQRFRTRAEIQALTAEGRLSAVIVYIMPFFMLAYFTIKSPDFTKELFVNPTGRMMLIGAIIMQNIGGFIIYRMINSVDA